MLLKLFWNWEMSVDRYARFFGGNYGVAFLTNMEEMLFDKYGSDALQSLCFQRFNFNLSRAETFAIFLCAWTIWGGGWQFSFWRVRIVKNRKAVWRQVHLEDPHIDVPVSHPVFNPHLFHFLGQLWDTVHFATLLSELKRWHTHRGWNPQCLMW